MREREGQLANSWLVVVGPRAGDIQVCEGDALQ